MCSSMPRDSVLLSREDDTSSTGRMWVSESTSREHRLVCVEPPLLGIEQIFVGLVSIFWQQDDACPNKLDSTDGGFGEIGGGEVAIGYLRV